MSRSLDDLHPQFRPLVDLWLARSAYGPEATTGKLSLAGSDQPYFTLEQPWRDNLPDHSCVPDGQYNLIPYNSPKHGPTWCLHNSALNIYATEPIPEGGRGYCEIHSANWAEQLKGCIALGLDNQPMFDPLAGHVEPAVEGSRDAVAHFIALLGSMSQGHVLMIQPMDGVIGTSL